MTGWLTSERESAAPVAAGNGARAIHKAEQKAPSLYTLMRQAQSIANEMPVTDLSIELMDALHVIIEILDELEGDPDFECNGDREHDPAELGELDEHGFQNEKPWDRFCKVFGGIYRGRSHV